MPPRSPAQRPPKIEIAAVRQHAEVLLHGHRIASSWKAIALHEENQAPVLYFPRDDVETHLLSASHYETFCPWKGTANHFAITVASASRQNAAWSYLEPLPGVAMIANHIAFYPEKVDTITAL